MAGDVKLIFASRNEGFKQIEIKTGNNYKEENIRYLGWFFNHCNNLFEELYLSYLQYLALINRAGGLPYRPT